ncbi:MAG: TonB-dependent receptor plug domain-containing protein, partial [Gemmatimonadetes bacterium]|nr:TonB-dependent receptor plug domain-containing protein [Gemmatimonadota bacterium]
MSLRWLAAAACLVLARAAVSQGAGDISVRVTNADAAPIRGARVEVVGVDLVASAGADGRAVLRLATGQHRLLVTALGYVPAELHVELPRQANGTLAVVLQRTALSLVGVTVTASPTARALGEVAAPVSTMDARALERSLASSLAATLSRQAGVTVRSQGPAASMPIIRGLTGDRIVVLQDGQRAADLAATASDHGITVDPLAARGIEVVRGPAALLYGS